MVVGSRRIRSDKLRENQYRERYPRSLEGKELEWDGDSRTYVGAGKTWNCGKCKRSLWISESWGEKIHRVRGGMTR